jgi:RHS repeat-associated protein
LGFGLPIDTGVVVGATDPVLLDDFDANGSVDLLAPSGGIWFVLRWTGSAFTRTSTGQTVDPNRPVNTTWDFVPADVNGDGLPDLVSYRTDGKFYTRLNTTAGGTVSFSPTVTMAYSQGTGLPVVGMWGNNSITQSSVRHLDFNGDARGDVAFKYLLPGVPAQLYVGELFSQGNSFVFADGGLAGGFDPLPVQWNDDSCTDLLLGTYLRIAGCGYTFPAVLTADGSVAIDWDGDNRTDLLADSGGILRLYRSTGDGVATPVSIGIPTGLGFWSVLDQDGDGLSDLIFSSYTGGDATYRLHNGAGVMPDLATSISDGFGLNVSFAYKSMSGWSACYGRDSPPPTFPWRAFVGALPLVCGVTASNGVGGTYQLSHSYYNSNLDLRGRGWLGFERRTAIDSRDGIVNTETYSQSFPHVGMAKNILARQSDGTTRIREITSTLSSLSFGSGYESRSFPYVSQSVEDSYEAGGPLNGQLITRANTTTAVDSFGNPTTVAVSVIDKSAASPWFGETYTTRTISTITNDSVNWCLGLPTQTLVTSTLPDGTSQTRTTASMIDYAYCRSTQDVIEPSSSVLRTTTTYGFDNCGNVNSVSIVGKNPDGTDLPARTTTTNYGVRCQFPESVTNALGQTTQRTFRYDIGLQSSETDPNGIVISWLYDGYGRKVQERRADGTSTTWSFSSCNSTNGYCGVSDLRWGSTQRELDTAGSLITQKVVLHDGLNRPRYDQRLNLAGGLTYLVVGYEALGRKSIEYVPVSTGGWHYHRYSYDLVNRPTADALYAAGGVLDRQTQSAYEGRKIAATDPKGNVTTRYLDVRGNLRRVVDPSPGGTTQYSWDHFGNLLTITDAIGAASSATYDVRGFKRTSYDVDAGSWTYTSNSLGELVSQTDAIGRTTTLTYDRLGRVTSRAELEGTSSWNWGASAADKSIGRLASMSGQGYSETYAYDSLGRPASITYSADSTYQVNFAYQASTGLLDNVTYPVSTAGYRLRAQYLYTNGILSQVRDFNAPATAWWSLIAEDARGNPIDEQFENGVHALSNFDELTGHLNWRTSGNNAQYNNHQNVTFAWDKNENLDRRIDVKQNNLTERFTYDALDRLTGSTLNGAADLALGLNAAGNITSKVGIGTDVNSDIGAYTYHPVKRHAVTSTSNGWTFTYDANGNMLSGRGSAIAWYSYNLPRTITKGSLTSQFFYTPDRRYWRQDANYATGSESTIHVGGLLEKVTSASGTQYRHMIRAGSAAIIVARHSNGTSNTYYATQDSLGSTAVITNAVGALIASENFGALGERRGSNWQGTPAASDWTSIASTTRRGFTGHTMVDNLSLIHMNGRMYDPLLGRFLSPDPFIQTLAHSQALNPYTYCWNNPLKYVDPSGFSIFSKLWKSIKSAFKSVLRSLNVIVGAALAVVGLVTSNPALLKVAAALIKSPMHVTKGADGYGVSFAWGFGAGTGSAASGAGPPLGTTPGIGQLPVLYTAMPMAVPWVIASEVGGGLSLAAQWMAAALGAVAGVAVGVLLPSTTANPADDEVVPRNTDATEYRTSDEEPLVTVQHFTSASKMAEIRASGNILRPGTYVTLPHHVQGMRAYQLEQVLEIQHGRGAYSTIVRTPRSNLMPAPNGPTTSGGAPQFQLRTPTAAGIWVPTPQ